MEKGLQIKNFQEEVQRDKEILIESKETENLWKGAFKIGLGCLVYVGLRIFFGPEMDYSGELAEQKVENIYEFFDCIGFNYGYICGLGGGFAYGFSYLDRRSSEKNLKKSESKLEEIMKS